MESKMQLTSPIRTNEELAEYKGKFSEEAILILPENGAFVGMPLMLMPQIVRLDSKPSGKESPQDAFYNNKDFFTFDYKEYSFAKKALDKIAGAGGLNKMDSEQVYREKDPKDDRVSFVKHKVFWEIQELSGNRRRGVSTGEYSFEEDKARYVYKKTENGHKAGDINWDQVNRRRNFSGALAESNATYRAICEAIAEIPKSLKKSDLRKVIIVGKVVPNVAMIQNNAPYLMDYMMANTLGIADKIYSAPGTVNNNLLYNNYQQTEPQKQVEDAEHSEVEPDKLGAESQTQPEAPQNTEPSTVNYLKTSPEKLEPEALVKAIAELLDKTKYQRQSKTPIEKLEREKQNQLYNFLVDKYKNLN